MESMDGGSESKITSLKYKRAAVKRRVTNTLKKLDDSVEQYGRKAIIRGYVNILRESLKEKKDLNDQVIALLPENEHEDALKWYEDELERVQDKTLHAEAHLHERKDESSSGLSSVSLGKHSSNSRSQIAEIRAKVTGAEIKAKQLAMEEQRRKQELAKQLELKKELEIAKFEAEERRKTQEAKDEAARLAAEAEILEKEVANDPEALPNRLLDFDYDSVDMSPPSDADKPVVPERSSGLVHNAHDSVIMVPSSHVGKSVVHQPLSKVVLDAQVDCGNVLSAKNTSDTVTSSPLFLQPKSSVASPSPQSAAKTCKVIAYLSILDWRFAKGGTT